MPGLLSGSLLVFSVSMSAFITPALMGAADVRWWPADLRRSAHAYDWPAAASLTIV